MKVVKHLLLFILLLHSLHLSALCGNPSARHDNEIPMTRFILPYQFGSQSAASFLAEGGNGLARANGTFGFYVTDQLVMKVGADFLYERHKLGFQTGDAKKWGCQIAGGAVTEYVFYDQFLKSIKFGGLYSYAPSYDLSAIVTPESTAPVERAMVGSNYYKFMFGLSVKPWPGGCWECSTDYGVIKYRYQFCPQEKFYGFGGRIGISQYLTRGITFRFFGEQNVASSFYEFRLTRPVYIQSGDMDLGVYVSNVKGRNGGLNSDTRVGVEFNFIPRSGYSIIPSQRRCIPDCCDLALLSWVSDPAVYLPSVYAVADQSLICISPSASSTPISVIALTDSVSVDVGSSFTGTALVFTASNLPPGTTINSSTGVISGNYTGDRPADYDVLVTATNDCGTVSKVANISFPEFA